MATGSGSGTLITSTVTGLTSAATIGPCVSFARSLEILNLDNKAGAYGYLDTSHGCEVVWRKFQREGWVQALEQAQAEIERDLGAPLCPKQICGERHLVGSTIRLQQAPVAYLGEKTPSDWTEVLLTKDGANPYYYIEVCEADLPDGVGSDDLSFSYPDAILATYTGVQALQAPIVSTVSNCNGTGTDGYRFTWPTFQLVDPTEDEVGVTETEKLITDVKWRYSTIDADAAYEVVGYCGCSSCKNEDPNYTLSLCDETEGLVCIEQFGTRCTGYSRQIRLNYGSAFSCEGEIAADLEQAVVLLALVKTRWTEVKPCGCDNSFIDRMLEDTKFSPIDSAVKMRYGITEAGMAVLRIIDKYKERPHFNTIVTGGGLLSARSLRKRNRYGL